jgi:outer membrane protein assembly factor BamB
MLQRWAQRIWPKLTDYESARAAVRYAVKAATIWAIVSMGIGVASLVFRSLIQEPSGNSETLPYAALTLILLGAVFGAIAWKVRNLSRNWAIVIACRLLWTFTGSGSHAQSVYDRLLHVCCALFVHAIRTAIFWKRLGAVDAGPYDGCRSTSSVTEIMIINPLRLLWVLTLATSWAAGTDAAWPRFRGPNGSGVDSSTGYPTEFSPAKNVAWKVAVPYGQSSPVVAGGRVYVTASEGDKLLTISLDARTGRESWRREVRREHPHKTFRANDPASPTPVADANGVISFFPDFGLIAYTRDGKEQWRLPLGPFKNFYGMAASPVIAGDLVVLICDQLTGGFAVAVDRTTGRQRWKSDRGRMNLGWATPMVFQPAKGQAELIVLGTTRVDSYYLATGEPRWWMPVASMGALGTPVTHRDAVLVMTAGTKEPFMPAFEAALAKYDKDKDGRLSRQEFSADPDMGEHFGWVDSNSDNFIDAREWNEARALGMGDYGAAAIRPGAAHGQLQADAVAWRFQKNLPYLPAPLVYQDVYYMVRTGGIVTSLDPATGRLLKEGRSPEALGEYYASPVAADGKIFLASEEGKISVLKAAGQWEVLSVNDLGEEIHATPALSGGRIYVRTRGSLYCFAAAGT